VSNANLYALFRDCWDCRFDRPALIEPGAQTLTFAMLDDLSARMAATLVHHGVSAGDRVVAQVEKSIGAIALYLACLRAGAILVPLNTAYTAAEIAYFLEDAEPTLFVSTSGESAGGVAGVALGTTAEIGLWAEALASEPLAAIHHTNADDIAAIVYTSGTTGRSKGAMLTHGNLASNAATLRQIWGYRPDDVLIHALPIFHVHGLFIALNSVFLNATPCIFLAKFDPAEVRAQMRNATILMGVPTFYTRLLADPDFGAPDMAGMRLFISGSAPLLAETHREFEARTGRAIIERYGMTETGIITSNPLDGAREAGTVGYGLPGVEVRVADAAGQEVPRGETGTVEVRGPNVFKGYWRNPQKTAEELRADAWFITGDVGTMAEDGRLTLAGRAKDLIISGGYNIYPKEIEGVIDAVSGVVESAVIGAPHPDFGESVVAVIVGTPDQAALDAAIATNLARFKHPRHLAFVDDLPRNAMGKVQKNLLRERYAKVFAA
jgi:malonyl-CoA/methylmalonyl-CoA synthetase